MSQSNVQKEGLVHRELSKAGEIIERESRVVYGLTDEAARSLAYLYPLYVLPFLPIGMRTSAEV